MVLPDDWSTRHSVHTVARRTAALVNALGTETPAAPDPAEVAAVLRAHGETGPLELHADDVADMTAAAGRLRAVFAAEDVDGAAAALNRLLREGTGRLRLTSHRSASPWHPHLDGDDEAPWGEWLLASSCLALTVLVWDAQRPPGGVCAAAGCRNVYLALGAGAGRRYCSRRCATRERVAAHRRAQRAGG